MRTACKYVHTANFVLRLCVTFDFMLCRYLVDQYNYSCMYNKLYNYFLCNFSIVVPEIVFSVPMGGYVAYQ